MIKVPDLQWSDAVWYNDAELKWIKLQREPDLVCWYFHRIETERPVIFLFEELITDHHNWYIGSQTNLLVMHPMTWDINVLKQNVSKEEALEIIQLIDKYEFFTS